MDINSGIMKHRLIDAIKENNIGAVDGFLERGINPNFEIFDTDIYMYITPLMISAQNIDMTITISLMANGANINFKNESGSVLHWAVQNLQLLRLLLLEGVDPFIRDIDGETPYDLSIRNNYIAEAEILKNFMDIARVQRINRRRMTRNRVKTIKNSRRLALMKSMESREGPMSSVRYDPSLLEHISRHL